MTFSVASDVALPQFPNLICHHFLFRFASLLSDCQEDIYIFFFFALLDLVNFFGAQLVQWWEHVSQWHTAALPIWFCWPAYFQLHATVCAEMSVAICRATQFWIILVIELRSQFSLYILCTFLQKETQPKCNGNLNTNFGPKKCNTLVFSSVLKKILHNF